MPKCEKPAYSDLPPAPGLRRLVPRQAMFAWLHTATLRRRPRCSPLATGQTFLEAALNSLPELDPSDDPGCIGRQADIGG